MTAMIERPSVKQEHTPIPPSLWRQIVEFLQSERSGSIELHIREGEVKHLSWRYNTYPAEEPPQRVRA